MDIINANRSEGDATSFIELGRNQKCFNGDRQTVTNEIQQIADDVGVSGTQQDFASGHDQSERRGRGRSCRGWPRSRGWRGLSRGER